MRKQGLFTEELEKFYASVRARALLVAVDWAGSARKLSLMCALSPDAGVKWLQRNEIPPAAAYSLSLIEGFPLRFEEMCPGANKRTEIATTCPHCKRQFGISGLRNGCQPSFNRRSEARARKLAAKPVAQIIKQRAKKRKQLA